MSKIHIRSKKLIAEAKRAIKPLILEIEYRLIQAYLEGEADGMAKAQKIYTKKVT